MLFCASTVSAADEAIFVNGSSGLDTNDGYSWDTPKLTIQNATGTVSSNGVVNIANGVYTGPGNTNITINKNMTIQGLNQEKTIIDGNGTSWIFNITSGTNVTLANLILINAKATNGGAIYNKGISTIIDTTFIGNEATGYGGAIYNQYKMQVTDSTFLNNKAVNGGAIMNGGTLTVTGSSFTGNNATQNDGGAIYTDGTLNVTSSTFTSNVATRYGGAIYNYDTLTVTSSNFNSNSATENGGAIYNHGISTITNSTFPSNYVINDCGGAIYNDKTLIVNGSTFTSNNAGYEGGAIFNRKTATVTGSTFTSNSATDGNGGAIYNGDKLTVIGSNFSDNTAKNGGAIYNNNNLIANSSTFFRNSAHDDGGAICSEGDVDLHFNRIVTNSAEHGIAIYNSKGDVNVTDNWWGSNDPVWTDIISGMSNPSQWLYMIMDITPTTINNTQTSLVTVSFNNIYNGTAFTSFDPITGHIPDGTIVTYSCALGSFNPVITKTIEGIATALFTANQTGTNENITATTDNQTFTQLLTVNPASYLYLNVTNSETNPSTGEIFVITYKLSNNGPDNATNVTISFQIPSGLEFVNATVDNGTWTYNPANRTVTWTLDNVAVGDPYLYLTVRALGTGNYTITTAITSETFNGNTDPLMPFSIGVGVEAQDNSNSNTVNAASTTKTVPMQTTGMPIAGLVLAILAVLGGIFTPRKK